MMPQPVSNRNVVLLWNGEIFGGVQVPPPLMNDTEFLFHLLAESTSNGDFEVNLMRTLSTIEGPYAFVIFNKALGRLWFGRDPLGRRSLVRTTPGSSFLLSSVCLLEDKEVFEEVPVTGIFSIDLKLPGANLVIKEQLWNSSVLISPYHIPWSISEDPTEIIFYNLLKESVRKRVQCIDSFLPDSQTSPVAILFSGGLDSTVLAALTDQCLPYKIPIDLLNISFENPRFLGAQQHVPSSYDLVPDRISGKISLKELQTLNNERLWRFIEINISMQEYEVHKQKIVDLMRPCDTVMDLSISAPFYFCSRGKGNSQGEPFESKAKVLMTGFAADELLGGYSRYRVKYEQFGEAALLQEMDMDFERMWKRNLGRDDRILSSFGKESRYPFLDENFVRFVRSLPLSSKVDFQQSRGIGEKIILRKLAESLGLNYCSTLSKRAIQFGAKTAKMTSKLQSGTDKIQP